jgi:hypothetical protein
MPRRRRLVRDVTGVLLLAFGAVFYVLARVSGIFDSLPCVLNDLYGGKARACEEAISVGRANSLVAPYVVVAFFLYVAGSVGYLLHNYARYGDQKAIWLVGLWLLGIVLILSLQ